MHRELKMTAKMKENTNARRLSVIKYSSIKAHSRGIYRKAKDRYFLKCVIGTRSNVGMTSYDISRKCTPATSQS